MELAPIVLFVYNRPDHTRQTLEALASNELSDKSELFIFSDGPKEDASEKVTKNISEVRKVIRERNWCGKVTLFESDHNKGLAHSIIQGVTEIVSKYGKIIVLEDDLITSPYFLKYMNECLIEFKDNSNVFSVNGYMFPIETEEAKAVLLPYTSTWGWGTWKNKWDVFDFNMVNKNIIKENPFLSARFNMADYPYVSMLDAGNNSWGIRWYYSVFIRNGVGVFPTKSLVVNIGFDNTGINCNSKPIYEFTELYYPSEILIKTDTHIDIPVYSSVLFHFKKPKSNILVSLARRFIFLLKSIK